DRTAHPSDPSVRFPHLVRRPGWPSLNRLSRPGVSAHPGAISSAARGSTTSTSGSSSRRTHRFDYVAANLRCWLLEKRAWAGLGYLDGLRELRTTERASASRVQLAVRFNLPG